MIYANLLREQGYGELASIVRRERDAAWWETQRSTSSSKRKREAPDLVHARRGDHVSADDFMVKIWGLHWRQELQSHTRDHERLDGCRKFVAKACEALRLPEPPRFFLDKRSRDIGEPIMSPIPPLSLDELPMPLALDRDAFFFHHSSNKVQLEFVVDNLSVAGLANATQAVTNPMHEHTVHSVRTNLFQLYQGFFGYKGGYLDPVDWRAREWNGGADFLVKYAMGTQSSGGNLTHQAVRDQFGQAVGLQCFSDGGFSPGVGGGFGVQIVGYKGPRGLSSRFTVGYLYCFVNSAKSAFEMEMAGINMATAFVLQACQFT